MPEICDKKLSVIIPVYNYRERIVANLETLVMFLRDQKFDFELIVVDDGSVDGTAKQIAAAGFGQEVILLELPKNMGKGAAVKAGVEKACGEKIIFIDADLPYRLEAIVRIYESIGGGSDLAIGDRTLPQSKVGLKSNIIRSVMSKLFVFFVRRFALRDAHDTQCGLKGFSGMTAKKIFNLVSIYGFGFDAEALAIAEENNLKIERIPVEFTGRDGTTVKIWRDGFRMIKDLLTIRKLKRAGVYKF